MHLLKSNRLRTSVRLSQKPCTSLLPRSSWTRYDGKAYHGLEKRKMCGCCKWKLFFLMTFWKKSMDQIFILFTYSSHSLHQTYTYMRYWDTTFIILHHSSILISREGFQWLSGFWWNLDKKEVWKHNRKGCSKTSNKSEDQAFKEFEPAPQAV